MPRPPRCCRWRFPRIGIGKACGARELGGGDPEAVRGAWRGERGQLGNTACAFLLELYQQSPAWRGVRSDAGAVSGCAWSGAVHGQSPRSQVPAFQPGSALVFEALPRGAGEAEPPCRLVSAVRWPFAHRPRNSYSYSYSIAHLRCRSSLVSSKSRITRTSTILHKDLN